MEGVESADNAGSGRSSMTVRESHLASRGRRVADAVQHFANVFSSHEANWIWAAEGEQCFLRRTFDVPEGFRRAEISSQTDELGRSSSTARLRDRIIHQHAPWAAGLRSPRPIWGRTSSRERT